MQADLLDEPLISIVIPSLNQGQFIEQAISSILGQQYPKLELIIIDGGSTDQTLSVIQKYADSISYYISEADHGQANAINKGFRLAKGDILTWLNSDDMYLPCTLAKIARLLGKTQEPNLVYGGCLHFYEGKEKGTFGYLPTTFDADKLIYQDYIVQPSTFWSRSLWKLVGELNESYNYVLDWDWFIRASKVCTFTPVRDYWSIYRSHEAHKTSTGGSKRSQEIIKVVETYASKEWISVYQDVYLQITALRAGLNSLSKFRLYRLRHLFYPQLYFKHGHERIQTVLTML